MVIFRYNIRSCHWLRGKSLHIHILDAHAVTIACHYELALMNFKKIIDRFIHTYTHSVLYQCTV